jgi:integrase
VRGKGQKYATIGLPEQAATALHAWRERYLSGNGHPRRDDPVFCTGQPVGFQDNRSHLFDWHTPLTTWGVRAVVQRRAEEAGLGAVATHDLRRSFAGFLDERGVPLQDLQAALRHSSPDTTVRAYLDKSPMRALRAVADLEL